jgi:hypothetical protein
LLLAAAVFASCKDATQVDVVLRTNVPYAAGAGVAIWSSRSGAVGTPLVESTEPWLADGEVGNVVVTPGDASKESALTVRVAMGLRGKRAAECTDDGELKGCIIARRKLGFVPHTHLKVPVVLYLACEGVKCAADTTCSYLGQCVPAQVDPTACATPDGCSLPGEPPFAPGVTVGADAGTDESSAAVADAGSDAGNDADAGPTGPELTAGQQHTCARLDDGSVKCWGSNVNGQLGLGDTQQRGDGPGELGATLPAVDLGPGRTALQLTAGYNHTCARLDDGSVKCWGLNDVGQLGLGDTQSRGSGPAARVPWARRSRRVRPHADCRPVDGPAPDALRRVDGLLTAHPSERKVPAVETHASPCRSLRAALALPRDKPVSPRMPCRPRRSRATARTRSACPGSSC